MKQNKTYKLLIFISLLILSLFIVESVNCQPWRKPRKKQYNKYVDTNDFGKQQFVKPTDTVSNRDIEINLELISRLATMEAFGTKNARVNGKVILELHIDTNANLVSMNVVESTHRPFGGIALKTTRNYFQNYKPLPAKKDGVPVAVKNLLIPVIFDMSIIEDSNQNR